MITETLLYSREIDHAFPIAPQVYSYLRARSVDNLLPPGAKISEASLADTLNISRTPLRAALQKLATEGLVNTRPHVGTAVAKLDVAQLPEAVFIRAALEAAVVRKLAEMQADLSTLNPILEIQKRAADRDHYDGAFHSLFPSWQTFWSEPPSDQLPTVAAPAPFEQFLKTMRAGIETPSIRTR